MPSVKYEEMLAFAKDKMDKVYMEEGAVKVYYRDQMIQVLETITGNGIFH